MTVQDIIQILSSDNSPHFPRSALMAARKNWSELLPEIHRLLDDVVGQSSLSQSQEEFLFWSILLLGDRGETNSFERLIRLCEQDSKRELILDWLLEDPETFPTILYILSDGRTDSLSRLITSYGTGEYIKVEVMRVLYRMYYDQTLASDFFVSHAPLWLSSLASGEQPYALAVLGCFLIDLKLTVFQAELLKLDKEGLIDTRMLSRKEIESWRLPDEYGVNEAKYIHSSFDIMSIADWWSFQDKPYLAPSFPPNRNDPCFCGSGKKYKKCCMN